MHGWRWASADSDAKQFVNAGTEPKAGWPPERSAVQSITTTTECLMGPEEMSGTLTDSRYQPQASVPSILAV